MVKREAKLFLSSSFSTSKSLSSKGCISCGFQYLEQPWPLGSYSTISFFSSAKWQKRHLAVSVSGLFHSPCDSLFSSITCVTSSLCYSFGFCIPGQTLTDGFCKLKCKKSCRESRNGMGGAFWSPALHLWSIGTKQELRHSVVKFSKLSKEPEHSDFYVQSAVQKTLAVNSVFVRTAGQMKHLCRPHIM